jgi:two-component system response regulator CpxR
MMPIITLFCGVFCGKQSVLEEIVASTGYKYVTDNDVVMKAIALTGVTESNLRRAFCAKTSVFNKFTHEKECAIAYLRLAMAEILADEGLIIDGFSGLLVHNGIDHVLRVCLIAEMPYRIKHALKTRAVDENEARRMIQKKDAECAAWVETLFAKRDPWDDGLYDIVIPRNSTDKHQASKIIEENLLKNVLRRTAKSEKAQRDFLLASRAEAALRKAGHDVSVTADDGAVSVNINKHVLMLGRLVDELKRIVQKVPGVTAVKTTVGKDAHKADIYRIHNFDIPSRVLLVDDEREFVQTLSERLQLRDVGSAIAYDGKSALTLVEEDGPEVLILDLKMPDMDGIEVLKKVKKQRPEIEVIILTGHGSASDRKLCLQLGAFEYLQKPMDINHLSEVLKKAHDKFLSNMRAQEFRHL